MWLFLWTSEPNKVFVWDSEAASIWVGDNKVYPSEWRPSGDTLLYIPMNSTTTYTDQSVNNVQTVNLWVTFWLYQWVNCGYFDWSSQIHTTNRFTIPATWTICVRIYYVDNWWIAPLIWQTSINLRTIHNILVWSWRVQASYSVSERASSGIQIGEVPSWWCMLCRARDLNRLDLYLYKNWIKYYNYKVSDSSNPYTSFDESLPIALWFEAYRGSGTVRYKWWMSEFVMENNARGAQKVENYYNQTKANYWL